MRRFAPLSRNSGGLALFPLSGSPSLIAFASRRSLSRPSGRVALLSQARRQMLAKLPLIPYPAPASRAFLAALAITTHEVGSGARLCRAIATSNRPVPGGREQR